MLFRSIEIEPLTGNDFRCRYYFTPIKNVTDIYAQSIKYAVLASLFIDIITSPLSVSIDNVLKNCIAALSEDKEIKKLKSLYEKGKSATDIESLEIEIKRNIRNIDEYIICKKRSNFYEILRPYRKVKSISVAAINENNERVSEITISKNDFKTFILTTDDLDPENNENAVIEIVAPVLKNSNYNKWVGVYDGELINFYMGSDEFRTMVQKGKVEFKNGTSIICHLRTSKRMNHEGEVKITQIGRAHV